jgi:hypothetical protein
LGFRAGFASMKAYFQRVVVFIIGVEWKRFYTESLKKSKHSHSGRRGFPHLGENGKNAIFFAKRFDFYFFPWYTIRALLYRI